jgi:pyridoxamine 5'-phosphate oxidase
MTDLQPLPSRLASVPGMNGEVNRALPPWRPLLRAARQREGRAPGAGWLQLATVSAEGCPRVRTLVFRGWSAQGELELLTDTRSEKPSDLLHQPRVELCWLFRKTREQFRLRGLARIIDGEQDREALEQHWQRLTPRGRAVWGWPQPGEGFNPEGPWPEQIPDGAPKPEVLALIRVQLERVEQLDLKPHPHLRRCWLRDQGWLEQHLNP